MFCFRVFRKSISHACRGFCQVWKDEQNFRFQIVFGVFVLAVMFVLPTTSSEKVLLIILISLVLLAEMINTVFERMADVLKPRIHDYIAQIKDITAAMVLVTAFLVVVAGLIIFVPYLSEIF